MPHAVVIGGGVIGLASAYDLRTRGWDVTILDARQPGMAASKGNMGWITPTLSEPVPAPGLVRTSLKWMLQPESPLYVKPQLDLDFIRFLISFWRNCNPRSYNEGLAATAELNRRTMDDFDALKEAGVPFEMHKSGLLFVFRGPEHMDEFAHEMEHLKDYGYDALEPLIGAQLREFEPVLTDALYGGYWISKERHVRPETLTAGYAQWLASHGVEIRTGAPVLSFDRDHGVITGVRTPAGHLKADAFLIAAGAWSGEVAKLAGVRLPIQAGKGYSLDYSPPPFEVRHSLYLHDERVAVSPYEGTVRLGGTMELSGINERILQRRAGALAKAGHELLRNWPAKADAPPAWTGMRPMSPDGLPVIGFLRGYRNLAVATGHAMLGVTLGPTTGAVIGEMMTTNTIPDILRPFSPNRFSRW